MKDIHPDGDSFPMSFTTDIFSYVVIKDCIWCQRSVSDMLARCRKIVGYYKHSHLAVERLQAIQRQLSLPDHKLVQDEPT